MILYTYNKEFSSSLLYFIIKICNGEKGAINLNNMIPVVDKALIKMDIQQEEVQYRNLLYD